MDLNVLKRGGGIEPFNIDKVINSVTVAGLSAKEAQAVGELAMAWSLRNAQNNQISSMSIRDKVVEILNVIDEVAGGAYEAYKKNIA